jgi:hypothetical protein
VCDDAQYLALLETGIHPDGRSGASGRALYVEVFPYDVTAHPASIAQAHAELISAESPQRPLPAPNPNHTPNPRINCGIHCQ